MRPSIVLLLCLAGAANTFSISAFPPLLPEVAAANNLSDREIGAVAAMLGFARMVADIPVGIFLRRHLKAGLLWSPLLVTAGVLCLASGGPLALLLIGRALVGVGHALGMVGSLTALLRFHGGPRLGAALNALELSAMMGLLGGVTLLGALPQTLAWNTALWLTCTPQLVAIVIQPWLQRSLSIAVSRMEPAAPPTGAVPPPSGPVRPPARPVVLAFATGAIMSVTYSLVEQFLIPLRGSRELGLERAGIARLLQITQLCDIAVLLPAGILADRWGAARVLALAMIVMAGGTALVGFGTLAMVMVGCVLFGGAMAGWMLPLSLVRRATAPEQVPWRTALYRVGVDAGIFLGPFLAGVLSGTIAGLLPALLAALLATIGVLLFVEGRRAVT